MATRQILVPGNNEQAAFFDDYITEAKLAQYLHISSRRLQLLRYREIVPGAVRVGVAIVYRRQRVREWLETPLAQQWLNRDNFEK